MAIVFSGVSFSLFLFFLLLKDETGILTVEATVVEATVVEATAVIVGGADGIGNHYCGG
jgi:hypothetical protein